MSGHGHVVPNPDGSRARCGGPGICAECSKELAQHTFPSGQGFSAVIPVEASPEPESVEPYDGRHIHACRKRIYDMKSSPCTCQAEFDQMWEHFRQQLERARGAEFRAEKAEAEAAAIRPVYPRHPKLTKEAFEAVEHKLGWASSGKWPIQEHIHFWAWKVIGLFDRAESAEKALADSKAEVERLRSALRLASRWLGTGDDTATFEDIAEWFRHETGFLRPGKDSPAAAGGRDEERLTAWNTWVEQKGMAVRGILRAALTTQAQPPAEVRTEPEGEERAPNGHLFSCHVFQCSGCGAGYFCDCGAEPAQPAQGVAGDRVPLTEDFLAGMAGEPTHTAIDAAMAACGIVKPDPDPDPDTLPTISRRQVEEAIEKASAEDDGQELVDLGILRFALGLTPPAKEG